jgi:hypothetical protein
MQNPSYRPETQPRRTGLTPRIIPSRDSVKHAKIRFNFNLRRPAAAPQFYVTALIIRRLNLTFTARPLAAAVRSCASAISGGVRLGRHHSH